LGEEGMEREEGERGKGWRIEEGNQGRKTETEATLWSAVQWLYCQKARLLRRTCLLYCKREIYSCPRKRHLCTPRERHLCTPTPPARRNCCTVAGPASALFLATV